MKTFLNIDFLVRKQRKRKFLSCILGAQKYANTYTYILRNYFNVKFIYYITIFIYLRTKRGKT